MSERVKRVVSITSPKGIIDEFIYLACPEEDCDWSTGDWIVRYEGEVRQNYRMHWLTEHAPDPPEPKEEHWSG